MGDLSNSERGQTVDARLAGTTVITVPLLAASRAAVSEVMSADTNHGKTTSAKRNSGRQSAGTERDRHTLIWIISRNHRTTAAQVNCTRSEDSS
jgi:hypothetical protein